MTAALKNEYYPSMRLSDAISALMRSNIDVLQASNVLLYVERVHGLQARERVWRMWCAHPENTQISMVQAGVLVDQGQTDAAIVFMKEVWAKHKTDDDVLLSLCDLLIRRNRADEAVAACQSRIEMPPERSVVWFLLPYILRKTGHLAAAIDAYKLCLQKENCRNSHDAAQINLYSIYQQSGRMDEAAKILRTLPEDYSTRCWRTMGICETMVNPG